MKTLYIGLFILCGILFQFLLHGLIEIWYINLLLSDFDRFGFGLRWSDWETIHDVYAVLLFIGGIWGGYVLGNMWWYRIYEPYAVAKPQNMGTESAVDHTG